MLRNGNSSLLGFVTSAGGGGIELEMRLFSHLNVPFEFIIATVVLQTAKPKGRNHLSNFHDDVVIPVCFCFLFFAIYFFFCLLVMNQLLLVKQWKRCTTTTKWCGKLDCQACGSYMSVTAMETLGGGRHCDNYNPLGFTQIPANGNPPTVGLCKSLRPRVTPSEPATLLQFSLSRCFFTWLKDSSQVKAEVGGFLWFLMWWWKILMRL